MSPPPMAARPSLELFGAAAALLLVLAFIASFAIGLRTTGVITRDPAPAAPFDVPPATPAGRIEVLNASGRNGLARAVTATLRDGGFDVVFFGTAAALRDSSVVLARIANDAVARAVARRLDIARVQTQVDTTLLLDATVILGRDWPK